MKTQDKSMLLGVCAGLLLSSAQAGAATLNFTIPSSGFTVEDFSTVAGTSTGTAVTGGNIISEAGFEDILLDIDGIDLDVYITDQLDGNPYFDGESGGKPAGLGSCRILSSSAQCNPSSDDNLTIAENESLRMDYQNNQGESVLVIFGNFIFRDDDHNLINGSVQVSHDGGSSLLSVTNGISDFSSIDASSFLLFNDKAEESIATTNYYISSAEMSVVPIPAAVWLFASALGALSWTKRRQKVV
jgi:hypothetical protein